jgi:hypothetical protein
MEGVSCRRNNDLPAWKQLYQSAILELDSSRLLMRIAEARRAIEQRTEETLTLSLFAEHRALNKALVTLQILEEVAEREKYAA